jgi:PIN domain nuclease of toxin-antitoxin system
VRYLLDTHALLWWLANDRRLGPEARDAIADPSNAILVSAISLWEILIKIRVGKLEADINAIERAVDRERFDRLPIAPAHLKALTALPQHHRDPFDHLLIAQAIAENATLLSEDQRMALYPVPLMRCSAL